MSNGSIDYSLGLETSGILGKLTGVNQAFDLLVKVIDGVGAIGGRVFQEIERGAALKDLSNRTGETVGNLFQLQFAFEQSGIAAGNVPGTLLRFQKSLSGVGEMGENTAEAFAALKLNIADLRNLDSPTALAKIFQGLNGLDRNSAADVAARIFGRGSSGDILQLARDSEGFADSLRDAGRQAALFERSADAFDKFGDTIGQIKLELRGVFATIAQDITPALQVMLDAFKSRDTQTFGEALRLSLTIAFSESVNFFARALQAVFAALPGMWEAVKLGAGSVGDQMVASLLDSFATYQTSATQDLPVGDALREEMASSSALLGQVADEMRSGATSAKEVVETFSKAISAGLSSDKRNIIDTTEWRAQLAALGVGGAMANIARGGGASPANPFTGVAGGSAFGDANALERVGASFGGGASSNLTNSARQTANNTRESAKALYKMNSLLERMESRDRSIANV